MTRRPFLIRVLLFSASVAVISGAIQFDVFQPQELIGYDWLMSARPRRQTHPDMVIIEIADDTLKGLGRWPLPRHYHAALIKVLTDSQARLIVFDSLFSEASVADEAFNNAIRASGKVLLPIAFQIHPSPLAISQARSQAGSPRGLRGHHPESAISISSLILTAKPGDCLLRLNKQAE
jgi:CHASE2 domain-containing sensor protein